MLTLGQTLAFAGESPTKADPQAAHTQLALNLMTRRRSCQGITIAYLLNGKIILDPATDIVSATVLSGYATVDGGAPLPALATLILGDGATRLQTRNCLLAVSSVRMHPASLRKRGGALTELPEVPGNRQAQGGIRESR
jgi:hypothetical protein